MKCLRIIILIIIFRISFIGAQEPLAGEEALGSKQYRQYEKPAVCQSCHPDIYQQWRQAMMSRAYVHHWDEIEYFKLAVPQAEKDEVVAGVKAGCNGCHTPMAFLAGDVPPPRPAEGSRANESVSCDVCHTIKGFKGDIPYNFNYISSPGRIKYGPKPGLKSPHHDTEYNEFITTTEFCGTCHNEMSPYGVWVKSTQLEWKEGPYSREGVRCHKCHMPKAWSQNAKMSKEDWVAQHLFHGAHDPGKLAGAVELRMHPVEREVEFDGTVVIKVQLFNAKAGHKIPTGSVEDRIVWLDVTATDAEGKTYHLDVIQEKPGEPYFVIFGDQTNGDETYGAGRFLYVDPADSSGFTYIDFNKAYNPPCAFTPYATCPLPPPQNQLPIPIRAGEKAYAGGHH